MDRAMLSQHLQLAERHVLQADEHVRRQREIVEELERDGHDTRMARKLLAQFEKLQAMHIADRDRLARELSEQPA
jgi:hemerythrin